MNLDVELIQMTGVFCFGCTEYVLRFSKILGKALNRKKFLLAMLLGDLVFNRRKDVWKTVMPFK